MAQQTTIYNKAGIDKLLEEVVKKTGLKTINNQSLLGSGNIAVSEGVQVINNLNSTSSASALSAYQGKLLNASKLSKVYFGSAQTINIGSALNGSLSKWGTGITGGNFGTFYVIWCNQNSEYGTISVQTSASSFGWRTTNVATASGQNGYWGNQQLCISCLVPPNTTYYIYGGEVKDVMVHYYRLFGDKI